MKVLILSCNTGQGHNTAGKAVREELLRRGIPCKMLDTLRFGRPKTSGRASKVYVKTTTSFPAAFGLAYKAGELSAPVIENRRYIWPIRSILRSCMIISKRKAMTVSLCLTCFRQRQ